MTSNLGSDLIQEMAGNNDYEAMKSAVMERVGQYFRPEFINRVDESVVFHPLASEQIRGIAEIQLAGLVSRLRAQEIELVVDESLLAQLAKAGFDPVYGARPLKRAIQQQLENPLAQALLSGEFGAGDTVTAHYDNERVGFRYSAA
jgi:ATP-dependent Clp protease ATP-binding subunit ClpB